MGERKGNEGKKVMNGRLAHPLPCENDLLSTLSEKGGTKRPFSWVLAHNVKLCGTFPRFWVILGSFWVILGHFWGLLGLIC